MKKLRIALPGLALAALTVTGCFLATGQYYVKVDLPNPVVVSNAAPITGEYIDLNTLKDYSDHKDNLKGLADLAVLGTVNNNLAGAIDIHCEVWITPTNTGTLSETAIKATGTRLWGPVAVPAGGSKSIDWDTSAGLFDPAGKAALLNEVKGDGAFTLYVISTSGTYRFQITDPALVLVMNAGL